MTVPRLDLAPKRQKPLSLWNPLDYLLLLYWVFFFPQALRWYETTFGIGNSIKDYNTWAERSRWLQTAHQERNLWLQGLILNLLVAPLLASSLEYIGLPVDWFSVALGVVFGVAGGVAFCVTFGVAGGVAFSVAFGFLGGVALGIAVGVAGGISFGITVGITVGIAFGVAGGITVGVAGGVAGGISLGVTVSAVLGAGGLLGGVRGGVTGGVALGVAFSVASGITIFRPEALLSRLGLHRRYGIPFISSRITYVPWQGLFRRLTLWLIEDWPTGIHNANQLLQYTQQFIPVIQSVNHKLAQVSHEQLFLKVAILSSAPFDWGILRYSSASLNNKLKEQFIEGLFFLPGKRRLKARFDTSLRFDLPYRAATAGFWLLHDKSPGQATEAFSVVRELPHGEEMYQLACCLATAQEAETLEQKAQLANLHPVPTTPLLRPQTWQAIAQLRHAADNAQLMTQSYSQAARSLALNRALGALVNILDHPDKLPNAEKDLVLKIAKRWRDDFLELAADIGEIDHSQPVVNPYVAGDPVEGDLFVGRDDILKQLQELWLMGNQLQSVVLFGHRRMGKTSILRNLEHCLGNNLKVAYVNLLSLGHVTEGSAEVLITISDAIAKTIDLPSPSDDDLLRLPEITFKRYLRQVTKHLDGTGFIIALDEFEQLEELIRVGSLTPDFIKFLRGLIQLSPHIGFAFAGLHTLEEMTADYFNPFFASVLPIHVGYLSQAATRQLIANPNPDFTLNYAPGVLDEIYTLTAGQPYLTQLLGFQLVRLYNHQRFEQNTDRSHTFTHNDLREVIETSDLFSKGRYYFTGVWNQAKQNTSHQRVVLKVLAKEPTGLPIEVIARKTKLQKPEIVSALQTLERHDVVAEAQLYWRIVVPLFLRWITEHCID